MPEFLIQRFLLSFLLFFLLFVPDPANSQNRKMDSLFSVLKIANEDTGKINILNAISRGLMFNDPDSAIVFANDAVGLSEKLLTLLPQQPIPVFLANSLINLGACYYLKGNYATASNFYSKALVVCDPKNITVDQVNKNARYPGSSIQRCRSAILGSLANVYKEQGDYVRSVEFYLHALKIAEDLGEKNLVATWLGNIGIVYRLQEDFSKSLVYYFKALELAKKDNNKYLVAVNLSSIGTVYKGLKKYDEAMTFYSEAIKLDIELDNKNYLAANTGEIGNLYIEQGDPVKAQEYYFKALLLEEKLEDSSGIAIAFGNIGNAYAAQKKYREAENYFLKALDVDQKIGALDQLKDDEYSLSGVYSEMNRHDKAFEHYKKYIKARDSIRNEVNTKKQTRLEMQYDFNKQQAADSVKVAGEKKLAAAELKTEVNKRYSLYGGLVLVIIFAGFMFNRFRVTQKQKMIIESQKEIVEEQKKIVEEKNKDILDSIHYARRIQNSLLPTEKYISKCLGT